MVQTMKAFVRTSATAQTVEMMEVVKLVFTDEEVLVQVKAFGVGIHDRYFIPQTVHFPYVIGSEGAGTIVEVGNAVTGLAVGDNVMMSTSMLEKGGSLAEYVAVPRRNLVKMSANLHFAAFPVAGKTAIECMKALNLKIDLQLNSNYCR
ncbi:alcohol dehydrogenase catalytic domain-containing protein [Sporosarcina saromensis]|uniref:Alcohol dehydrogenase catalytic domain-containing protein n=1 Tax=Sporosarcina saromensis TaxID=359365 RepID=A0ABU4G7T2_9BACL|nr:alcohol dehydrogenase catalytic domain-containing protein [Sporosarcina saromensis]MDW0113039.1 alcohol dehydrogenase catalytic domain-containing protein [Sporosarcina saromensis]